MLVCRVFKAGFVHHIGFGVRHDKSFALAEAFFLKSQNGILNGHTERIRGPPGPLFIGGIEEYFADLSRGLHPRKQVSF